MPGPVDLNGEKKKEREERRVGGTFHEIPSGASTDFIIAASRLRSNRKRFIITRRTSYLSAGDLLRGDKALDLATQNESNKFERNLSRRNILISLKSKSTFG